MRLLELELSRHAVTCRDDGICVDLGGIGKGYAVDRIVELLGEWSVTTAVVQAGLSTAYACSEAPSGGPWSLQLRRPGESSGSLRAVRLRDAALSGSGRFHHGPHIIDPRTGTPVEGALGAWALAPSAAMADALSTAFMVMSTDEVEAYCGAHEGVSAALALPHGEDLEMITFGSGFGPTDVPSGDGGTPTAGV